MNTFIQGLNEKENTKGGIYHGDTFDSNLNLFATKGRHDDASELERLIGNAWVENKELAVKNVLNFLDIRAGKGERRAAKILIEYLLVNKYNDETKTLLNKLIDNIGELGRFDYLVDIALDFIGQEYGKYALNVIKTQLLKDVDNMNKNIPISLLVKWLPSINASSEKTKSKARMLIKILIVDQTEADYRLMLSQMRKYLNVLEVNMSAKTYDEVDYSKVPSQALRKHVKAFYKNDKERYEDYKNKLVKGEAKANAGAIWPSQIISDIDYKNDIAISDGQWNNLPDFFETDKNVLVMADVSGSMRPFGWGKLQPIHSSVALAIYTAERNKGAFKNIFMTFSETPRLVRMVGNTISEKFMSVAHSDYENSQTTNIDKAFDLVLESTLDANKEDLPEYIVIVSDMEFDESQRRTTNFRGWKEKFEEHGLTLPKIVFWNVALETKGFPVTKLTKNVAMVSGDSPSILSQLFKLEELTPTKMMVETLAKYDKYIA